MAQLSPDIARFGAALVRGAEEERADEHSATYKVHARFADLAEFYRAVYGKQKGIVVEAVEDEASPMVLVAVSPDVQDADFATLVVSRHPEGEPNRFQVLVTARGEGEPDDEDYPDSSPWAEPV